MTSEERAEKWLRNVPHAEALNMEARKEICRRVAKKVMLVSFAVLALEIVLLFLFDKETIFNDAGNFVINGTRQEHDRSGVALTLIGVCILYLPLMALPLLAAVLFRKKEIPSAVNSFLAERDRDETCEQWATDDESEQFANHSGKRYADWGMDSDDEESSDGFTMADVRQQLAALKYDKRDSIYIWVPDRINVDDKFRYNYVFIYQGDRFARFDVEIFTIDIAHNNHMITYKKENLSEKKTMETLQNLLDNHAIPKLQRWKVLADCLIEKSTDAGNYKAIVELLPGGETYLALVEKCIAAPKQYYMDHEERYEDRGMDETDRNGDIIWIAIADEMLDSGNAVELDWKETKEEFYLQMQDLAGKHNLELREEWLQEDGDIPTWCGVLDGKWEEQGFCIAEFDIDSDSYVLFICTCETLEKLRKLGDEVLRTIDLAQEM